MSEWVKRKNLIYELALKDLKIRYSRPTLGFLWAFLSPFFTVVIFYMVFSFILKAGKVEEAPFFLYLMSGVFPWQLFQNIFFQSVTSLMDSKNLLKESNFSPFLIVLAIALSNTINFLPSLFILLIVSAFILKGLTIFMLFLPLVLVLHLVITIGLSVVFSILYLYWRDTRYAVDIVIALLFYLTPVIYSVSLIKASFSPLLFRLYMSNPLVGIVNLYRSIVLKGFYGNVGKHTGVLSLILIPICFAVIISMLAFCFYKKNKAGINDYLAY